MDEQEKQPEQILANTSSESVIDPDATGLQHTEPEVVNVAPQIVSNQAVPEQPLTETVTTEDVKFVQTKLESLPPKIKKELDDLIKQGFGPARVKAALEDRYGPKDTNFLPTSEGTYHKYIQMHREELMKQASLEKSLLDTTKESLQDTKSFVNAALGNDSLENKKKALENLFKRIATRISLMEAQQTSFLSPQVETVMGAYLREQRAIIESSVQLREELERDASAQMYTQFENLTYAWLVTVLNVYKKINGEEKISEFKNSLKEELPKIIEAYKPK